MPAPNPRSDHVSPHTAPASYSDARHPYSPVREAAGLVFVSGQLGVADGEIVPGGIEAETRQAFDNLDRALAAVGLDRSDIVKIVVYLTSLADRLPMDEVYLEALAEPLPARTCFAVGELPFGARIELDVTAAARATRGGVG
jgi:reactive intermediate/imine deaminase